MVGKVLNITVGKKPSNLHLRYMYVMLLFTNKIQLNLHKATTLYLVASYQSPKIIIAQKIEDLNLGY